MGKISSYPAMTALQGPELILGDQSGATGTTTPTAVAAYMAGLTTTPVIASYARTAAEIAADVTPTNYAYPPGDVRRYGALFNGSTDDTAAINAALSVGGVVRFVPSATAVVNGVLTHNVATTLVDGQGATLNFRSNTNSSVWVITTTDNDPTTQYLVHRAHPMQNMMLLGPAYTANVDCFTATPILNGSTYWMGGLLWDNVGIVGFRNMYTDCAGAIFWEWRGGGGNSDVNYTGGTFLKLVTDGTDNAGENHELNHVIIGDIQGAIWDSVGNANCDIFCTNCSFDGLGYVVTGGSTAGSASAGCVLYLDGCHVEAWTAATYIAATSGAFVADGTTFVLSNAITSAPFNSTNSGQGASVSSGVQLLNCRWALGSVGPVYLCDGTGVFVATNNKLLGIYSPGLMSQYNNLINNFIFSGSSPFTSWTTSGTVSASTSNLPTGVVPTPTASMEISGAGSYAEITLPIRQDMLSTLEFYAETTGISTGDSFECALLYLNHSGTQIGSMSFLIANGANVSWGLNSVSIGSAIAGPPQGTTGVTIQFIVNGAGIGYIALPMFAIV